MLSNKRTNNQNNRIIKVLKHHAILFMTVLGVIFGVILGLALRSANLSYETIMLVAFPGDILMRMLKMLVLPLITSSLITGVSMLDPKSSGKIGLYSMVYFLTTSIFSAFLGLLLVISIKPGEKFSKSISISSSVHSSISTQDAILDLIRNMFPENLMQATIQQGHSVYTLKEFNLSSNMSKATKKWTFQYRNSPNTLGIISFCIAIGVIISSMGKRAEIVINLFSVLNEITIKLVRIIMWYAPFGIMFLVAGKILEIEDLANTAHSLGHYMFTLLFGLFIHVLIVLPSFYFILTRKNPYTFYKGCLQAVITGFATASSSATLPVTFSCLEETLKLDKRVTRFILPIGTTINMDGAAMYQVIAPIFIAQLNNRALDIVEYLIICLTSTIASIGAASIPSAGLVTMVLVLQSVGLPVEDISIIVPVDFILDRFRTVTNILGDSIGAGIVASLCKDQLNKSVGNEDEIENDLPENDKLV